MLQIRPAEPADAPAIAALAREVHAQHAAALPDVFQPPGPSVVTAADIEDLLARPRQILLVASRADAFAGYVRAEVQEEPATKIKRASTVLHLHEMGVVPTQRRHGVGRALLRALRAAAVACGAHGVSLDVYAFNADARAFYAREGLVVLRERLVAPAEAATR